MSTWPWTHFRKREGDEDSSDNNIGDKRPVHVATPAIDVGPGGLSFEESASVHCFIGYLRPGLMALA